MPSFCSQSKNLHVGLGSLVIIVDRSYCCKLSSHIGNSGATFLLDPVEWSLSLPPTWLSEQLQQDGRAHTAQPWT